MPKTITECTDTDTARLEDPAGRGRGRRRGSRGRQVCDDIRAVNEQHNVPGEQHAECGRGDGQRGGGEDQHPAGAGQDIGQLPGLVSNREFSNFDIDCTSIITIHW